MLFTRRADCMGRSSRYACPKFSVRRSCCFSLNCFSAGIYSFILLLPRRLSSWHSSITIPARNRTAEGLSRYTTFISPAASGHQLTNFWAPILFIFFPPLASAAAESGSEVRNAHCLRLREPHEPSVHILCLPSSVGAVLSLAPARPQQSIL